MTRRPLSLALGLSLLAPALAFATEPSDDANRAPPAASDRDADRAPPDEAVPPPPSARPPTPPAQAEASPESPPDRTARAPLPPPGQWVFTDQYGWVWMPYDRRYVRAPPDGEPYMFVYGPTLGWSWVVAPWVWGWGPEPRFGAWSGVGFFWWGHGWGPYWHAWRPLPFRHAYPYRFAHPYRPYRPYGVGPVWRPGWHGGPVVPRWHGGPGWHAGRR